MSELRQFIEENFYVSLHYKAGIAKVAFQSIDNRFIAHSYQRKVEDMCDAFILYKAYNQFLNDRCAYVLITFAICEYYGISTVGRYLDEVISEIKVVQQQMKEAQADDKH